MHATASGLSGKAMNFLSSETFLGILWAGTGKYY
jgi:hypothetical protein